MNRVEKWLTENTDHGLPVPGFEIEEGRTAVVITDPQNDFLSPQGVTWGVVGESVTENRTVENIDSLFKAAKDAEIPVFVSPHYYYPHDHKWQFEGASIGDRRYFERWTSDCRILVW